MLSSGLQLPYTAAVTTASATLRTFRDNPEVKALRSIHRADLVTLLTNVREEWRL